MDFRNHLFPPFVCRPDKINTRKNLIICKNTEKDDIGSLACRTFLITYRKFRREFVMPLHKSLMTRAVFQAMLVHQLYVLLHAA